MKSTLLKSLLTIVFLLCSVASYAYDFAVDGIYYNITNSSEKTVEVTCKDDSYAGTINIPETVSYQGATYRVTRIGDYAFSDCDGLTSITIPNSVTSIGAYAFFSCSGLTSITIPNSVTSIGDSAFYCCSGLTSITIPNSVTTIDNIAFAYCNGLRIVNFKAENCTTMGSSSHPVFNGCGSLKTINIGDNVKRIPGYAFMNCYYLTEVTIPGSITTIGGNAFMNCTGLTTVNFNAENCTNMGSLDSPVFNKCGSLKTVNIGDKVKCIPDYAFAGCTSLTEISIGNRVTSIGYSAFAGCTGLTTVNYNAENCTSMGSLEHPVFYNCGSLKTINIGDNVKRIPGYAFMNCYYLTEVTIPGSITTIGGNAFMNCTGLTTVNFNAENCTNMGSLEHPVFNNCGSLKTVNIGDNVKCIPDYAFSACTALTTITIPNSATTIGDYAFHDCASLTDITIPNSVTSIGVEAFGGCKGLTTIVVNDGNTVYDSRDNCNAIIETATNTLIAGCQNTVIPNSVTSIGNDAFSGCTGITKITIDNNITKIGQGAFAGCTGLTTVNFNAENCTSMGNYFGRVFQDCSSLKNINIGKKVKSIPNYAFSYCAGLSEITIPNSVTTIGSEAFSHCTSLSKVTILYNVAEIGDCAFTCSDNIKNVYVYPIVPPTAYVNPFSEKVNRNATLHTPVGSREEYATALYWREFANISNDLTAIAGVMVDDNITISMANSTLVISGVADDAAVQIFTAGGALLHSTTVAEVSNITLPRGVYLVQVSGVTKKVVL